MSLVLFTVVDLETAGLEPPASIIEIGVTRLYFDTDTKAAEIIGPFSRLFKPSAPLAPENIAVHHLTDAMLAGFEECSDDILAEIVQEERPQFLVAAQADFERKWILDAHAGRDLSGKAPRWICTVKAASRLFPDAESHSNQATRYRLGLDLPEHLAMPPHRAGPDSYVTAHILGRFLVSTRVRDLVAWTLEPRLITKLPFGKYRGLTWIEVPEDYLDWLLKQNEMDPDVKHWARVELQRRYPNANAQPGPSP
jgi:exodeoxyribonuclease X